MILININIINRLGKKTHLTYAKTSENTPNSPFHFWLKYIIEYTNNTTGKIHCFCPHILYQAIVHQNLCNKKNNILG